MENQIKKNLNIDKSKSLLKTKITDKQITNNKTIHYNCCSRYCSFKKDDKKKSVIDNLVVKARLEKESKKKTLRRIFVEIK